MCLHVLLVPERLPWKPCASRRFSSSSSSRPLLLVFFQVYQARLTPACQFQRINLLFYPLVTGSTDQISFSYSDSSAYQLSQPLPYSSAHVFVPLQICNYRSLHISFAFCVALRSPSTAGLRLSVTSVSSLTPPGEMISEPRIVAEVGGCKCYAV